MCNIDDAERCSVWDEADHRASKEWVCTECRRSIARGERYRRVAGLYEGAWTIMRICAHCVVGANWLTAECGGYLLDGVREEIHEHAQEYRSASLWRLVVGADRKWTRFDGTGLMPIPKEPPLSHPVKV